MALPTALGTAAGLVALAFAMSTFERWLARRQRYQLAWTAAFAMFAVASFALATGAATGWSPVAFRVFYLFGAVANVPVLAVGTIYLLAAPRTADRWAAVVLLAVAVAAGVVIAAPLKEAALTRHELAQGSDVFGALPRVLAAVASSAGALVVLGGAVWSAVRYRRRGARRLLAANALIALGTAITGASGLLNSVAGAMTAFAVTLTVGITAIFLGYLVSQTDRPVELTPKA